MSSLDEQELDERLTAIFQDAQVSELNHKKNCASLHTLLNEAHLETSENKRGNKVVLDGERWFRDAFLKCVYKTLQCKKGDVFADRIASFVGAYVEYLDEQGYEDWKLHEEAGQTDWAEDDPDKNYAERFISGLLRKLLPGFEARDRTVRYRTLFFASKIVPKLIKLKGHLAERAQPAFRAALMSRAEDKEASIRALAAASLTIISTRETLDDIPDDEPTAEEFVLELLKRDASPEVRRAIMTHLCHTETTVRELVIRTRDVDISIRKLTLHTLKKCVRDDEARGPGHPGVMAIEDVEAVILNGLKDREPAVQNVAKALVLEWVNASEKSLKPEEEAERVIHEGVATLLLVFRVSKRLPDRLTVVETLLQAIFDAHPNFVNDIKFGAMYWQSLTAEKTLLARVLIAHLDEHKNAQRLEALLPTVTSMGECIDYHYQRLFDLDRCVNDEKVSRGEMRDLKFTLGELLRAGSFLDYADVAGARKIAPLLRRMLTDQILPQEFLPYVLDNLKLAMGRERNFMSEVLGVIHQIKSSLHDELPMAYESMSQENKDYADLIDAWCLTLCIHMLERLDQPIRDATQYQVIYNILVLPNLMKEFRDDLVTAALTCNSLSAFVLPTARAQILEQCLLSIDNHPNMNSQARNLVTQTVFDIVTRFPWIREDGTFWFDAEGKIKAEEVHDKMLTRLANEGDPIAQVALCEGLMKLLRYELSANHEVGVKYSPRNKKHFQRRILINLFRCYTHPDYQDNARLQQSLSTAFGAYALTTPIGQSMMRYVFTNVFHDACNWPEEQRVYTPAQICDMFEKWTNPITLRMALEANCTPEHPVADEVYEGIQVDVASDILKELYERSEPFATNDDRKALYQMLTRLYLPDTLDIVKAGDLRRLLDGLRLCNPPKSGPCSNALDKFEKAFKKKYATLLEELTEADWKKLASAETIKFFKESIPNYGQNDDNEIKAEEDDEPEGVTETRGKKRRSMASAALTDVEDATSSSRASSRPRRASKRPRCSRDPTSEPEQEDDGAMDPSLSYPTPAKEEYDEAVIPASPPPPLPQRKRPQNPPPLPTRRKSRLSTGPPPDAEIICISSDEGEGPASASAVQPSFYGGSSSVLTASGTSAMSAITIDDTDSETESAVRPLEGSAMDVTTTTTTTTTTAFSGQIRDYTVDSIFSNDVTTTTTAASGSRRDYTVDSLFSNDVTNASGSLSARNVSTMTTSSGRSRDYTTDSIFSNDVTNENDTYDEEQKPAGDHEIDSEDEVGDYLSAGVNKVSIHPF